MTSYISNFSMQKEMSKNFKKGITFVLPSTYFFVKKKYVLKSQSETSEVNSIYSISKCLHSKKKIRNVLCKLCKIFILIHVLFFVEL